MIRPSFLFAGAAAIALAAGIGGWKLGASKWHAKYLETQATLAAVRATGAAQAQAHQATQTALAHRATELEKALVTSEKSLRERASAAERRYAVILQNGARRRACPTPAAPADPLPPREPAGEPERLGELAALARAIGERALRDAERLAACQQLLRDERALLGTSHAPIEAIQP